MVDHPEIWKGSQPWFDKLDSWVSCHDALEETPLAKLGGWRRSPHKRFDVRSPAYQDMVFFHPFVRRAFFDTGNSDSSHEALVRNYAIRLRRDTKLRYEAEDLTGHVAAVEMTNVGLQMFANGIGILTLGVEAREISFAQALWINEMMRKIYPSSDRQVKSGRIPHRLSLVLEKDGAREVLVEEQWEGARMIGFRPQLSRIILELLRFANYEDEEFEPVLDERMIVNSFVRLDGTQLAPNYERSEEYDIAFSRLLYVDREGAGYRYDREFTREQMKCHTYRRWQHEGTLYGMTSYSTMTCILATPGRSEDNALVYRMFRTKNLLIALIALFYRASLLDFAKESALVSRQLFPVFSGQAVRHSHIQFATRLMANYNYFNNYWFFLEPTTKDEELEHFRLHCAAYEIDASKNAIGERINNLAGYIDRLYALRNTDAVNRLAMMSVILGTGALVTGYFGMNMPSLLRMLEHRLFSMPSLLASGVMLVASLIFVVYIVVSNWGDYRSSLLPQVYRKPLSPKSLRQLRHIVLTEGEEEEENS